MKCPLRQTKQQHNLLGHGYSGFATAILVPRLLVISHLGRRRERPACCQGLNLRVKINLQPRLFTYFLAWFDVSENCEVRKRLLNLREKRENNYLGLFGHSYSILPPTCTFDEYR